MTEALELNTENIHSFVTEQEIARLQPEVDRHHHNLESGRGKGAEFLGWLHLPSQTTPDQLKEIQQSAEWIRGNCETFVSIGIGGSYLGAKAAIDFGCHTFSNQIIFYGYSYNITFIFRSQSICSCPKFRYSC